MRTPPHTLRHIKRGRREEEEGIEGCGNRERGRGGEGRGGRDGLLHSMLDKVSSWRRHPPPPLVIQLAWMPDLGYPVQWTPSVPRASVHGHDSVSHMSIEVMGLS